MKTHMIDLLSKLETSDRHRDEAGAAQAVQRNLASLLGDLASNLDGGVPEIELSRCLGKAREFERTCM